MSNQEALMNSLACFADPARREQYLDLYSSDAVLHGYQGVAPGREGVAAFYRNLWGTFPDARVEVQEVIEAGDRLIVRFEFAGTQSGAFLGVPASGKPVRFHGITILRMRDGKCVERWSAADFLTALVQVGGFNPA